MLYSAAAASLFALGAHAGITGIGCPEYVKPGEPFQAVIVTDTFEEIVTDVSIAFGFSGLERQQPVLGGYADSFYFNEVFNTKDRFEREVICPESESYGEGLFTASLYSLYGQQYQPEVHDFFVKIKFAEQTSETIVFSEEISEEYYKNYNNYYNYGYDNYEEVYEEEEVYSHPHQGNYYN